MQVSKAKRRLLEWYAQAIPSRALRLISLAINHQIKTEDWFRYENARMIETAFGFVANNGVQGDYLEFGVYEGATFTQAWRAAERHSVDARFHAFDSFQGLPEIQGADEGGQFHRSRYAVPQDVFEQNLRRQGVDLARVTVTPGFFADTLSEALLERIGLRAAAVIWIDCDLYESTVPVLDFISHCAVDGAVLCFDDWSCYKSRPDRGEQRACADWLRRCSGFKLTPYRTFHWAGQSFILHRE